MKVMVFLVPIITLRLVYKAVHIFILIKIKWGKEILIVKADLSHSNFNRGIYRFTLLF